jgi:alkanesulfonate monooxygenase SsuD/methylene tetrahydromethanopterin reductase-like flavin-dependent oxidoreductase (luciferase family)
MGEVKDAKALAALLDEGLEVLTDLWSGEQYSHDGIAYHIKEAQFLPPPLQSPRIPIWVANLWPAKAPLRRAVRWDGIVPIGRDLPLAAMLTPEEMHEIVLSVASQPEYSPPFEVVHSGITGGTDAALDREIVLAYERVGVTWWIEKILPELWGSWTEWPLEAMRSRIRQGPPG